MQIVQIEQMGKWANRANGQMGKSSKWADLQIGK
jgi:hypothetical protein